MLAAATSGRVLSPKKMKAVRGFFGPLGAFASSAGAFAAAFAASAAAFASAFSAREKAKSEKNLLKQFKLRSPVGSMSGISEEGEMMDGHHAKDVDEIVEDVD